MQQSAYRRFLPHYQNANRTYFITFCSRGRRVLCPDLLLTPLETSLAETMKRIKGASAREVNRELGGKGSLWQREYFDREIRSDENLRAKGEYIANNPVRAGLVASPDEYQWIWRAWIEGGDEWR